MTLGLWTLVAVEIAAVASILLPIIIMTGARWWSNFMGRYLVYQSIGFALILSYAGYGQLAVRLNWSPLPQKPLVLLSIFTLLASIKVFGVVTFLRARRLGRLARLKSKQE